jgi:hypothetical protein
MALSRNQDDASRGPMRDGWYNARRFGALGLVSLASCVLRAAIGLYQRQMISQGSIRVALSITGRLEKSALTLLVGRKRNQSDAAAPPRRGGEP